MKNIFKIFIITMLFVFNIGTVKSENNQIFTDIAYNLSTVIKLSNEHGELIAPPKNSLILSTDYENIPNVTNDVNDTLFLNFDNINFIPNYSNENLEPRLDENGTVDILGLDFGEILFVQRIVKYKSKTLKKYLRTINEFIADADMIVIHTSNGSISVPSLKNYDGSLNRIIEKDSYLFEEHKNFILH